MVQTTCTYTSLRMFPERYACIHVCVCVCFPCYWVSWRSPQTAAAVATCVHVQFRVQQTKDMIVLHEVLDTLRARPWFPPSEVHFCNLREGNVVYMLNVRHVSLANVPIQVHHELLHHLRKRRHDERPPPPFPLLRNNLIITESLSLKCYGSLRTKSEREREEGSVCVLLD